MTDAGATPGLQAGDLTGKLLPMVLDHVRAGGALFVDSGAFPAFMAGSKPVNFDQVMARYETLVAAASNP